MLKLLFLVFFIFTGTIVSIYTISVTSIDSSTIDFNNYRGKTILIVNTASDKAQANQQFAELQQLYLQHKDSMVIIAFPSNSFGNETRTNAEIKSFMQGTYGITFPIAAKSRVSGDSVNVLFQWLGSKTENDVMNGKTIRDFQKYLIDKEGNIVAKFDSSSSPLSTIMQNAIHNN